MMPLDAAREDAAKHLRLIPTSSSRIRAMQVLNGEHDESELVQSRLSLINLYLASQQANAPELVERLRKRANQAGLLISDPPIMSPDAVLFTEAVNAILARDAQIAELQKQIEAKDKALRPFASIDMAHTHDISDNALVMENEGRNLTLGDFRAARAAMGGGE